MSRKAKRESHRIRSSAHALCTLPRRLVAMTAQRLRALAHRRRARPVEVLVVDGARRRAIERQLRAGLRQLRSALGDHLPRDLTVVAQQVIATDRPLAGSWQLGQRPDGTPAALVRLALQVGTHRLGADELLAALADACVGLANQVSGVGVLVPLDLPVSAPIRAPSLTALPPDPLPIPSSKDAVSNHHAA